MREGADLPVSEEPRYFRNRQLAILEIASGESSPKFLQYLAKACALGRKRARQGTTTETELARNVHTHPTMSEALQECFHGLIGHMINF